MDELLSVIVDWCAVSAIISITVTLAAIALAVIYGVLRMFI